MTLALPHRDGPCLRWDAPVSTDLRAGAKPPILLLHGFLDAAGSWDRVAPQLAAAGHPVCALDLRGHGEGYRAGAHDYYHFSDYLLDLDNFLQNARIFEAPFVLVGHSMGGMVGTLFAGTYPARVSHFVNVEGLGPPETDPDSNPARMRTFVEGVRKVRAQAPTSATREEMLRRLELAHAGIAREVLEQKLVYLAQEIEPGRFVWRYDPLHRTRGPTPFRVSVFEAFARAITAKVLYVSGGHNGFTVTGAEQRLTAFADLTRVTLEGAGHMVHWTQPDALAAAILAHVRT